jgi:hypothetical protein
METKQDLIWIASFDIGKCNFAWHVQEIDRGALQQIKNVPLMHRYNPDGTTTTRMENILTEIYLNGETKSHVNKSLLKGCNSNKNLDPNIFFNLTELLDTYIHVWDRCYAFVIEEQMAFRGKINKTALRIAQHLYSYFCLKYGRGVKVFDFPAYHKTRVLGAAKIEGRTKRGKVMYRKMDKPARKKWAVVKAIEILELRGEDNIVDDMRNSGDIGKRGKRLKAKLDDYADCVIQSVSFMYLHFVNKSI